MKWHFSITKINTRDLPACSTSLPPNLFYGSATFLLATGKFSPTGSMFFIRLGFCQIQRFYPVLWIWNILLQYHCCIIPMQSVMPGSPHITSIELLLEPSLWGKRMDQASNFRFHINLFVYIQHYCQFRCNLKLSSSLPYRLKQVFSCTIIFQDFALANETLECKYLRWFPSSNRLRPSHVKTI